MAKKRGRKKKHKGSVSPETKASIFAIILLVLAGLVMLSFTGQGSFLQAIQSFLSYNFGFITLFIPFLLIAGALILFKTEAAWSQPNVLIGGLIFTFGLLVVGKAGQLGGAIFTNLASLISVPGVYIFGIAIIIAGIFVMFKASFQELFAKWREWRLEQRALALERAEEAENEIGEQELAAEFAQDELDFKDNGEPLERGGFSLKKLGLGLGAKKTAEVAVAEQPLADDAGFDDIPNVMKSAAEQRAEETGLKKIDILGNARAAATIDTSIAPDEPIDNSKLVWQYPTLDLFSDISGGEADRGDVRAMAQIIQDTLESFGIKARVAEVNRGPSVTQYALEIAMGTKISKITSLSNNLALALAAPNGQIRIEAPIAGKSLVGIEVPNRKAAFVTLRHMLAQKEMIDSASKIAVSLGIDVAGDPIIADIAKMPHALIAGATGSGKSVGINSFLCSILFRASPSEVKLILVDPKRVEMTPYNDIPHLLTPVIYDAQKVVSALKWLTMEMDRRYKQLAEAGVRNIASYNAQAGYTAMPSIVLIVDEFADIMMYAPSEVEESITRIAQMARAVGIHMILATQRPSVNVITGLIKANIPTRISFNVTSVMDSRVVLDAPGAEKLLGNGDMLFIPPDKAKPLRIQGTYVSDEDIGRLTSFLKNQGWRPEYLEEVTTKFSGVPSGKGAKGGAGIEGGAEDRDPLFDEALKFFSQQDVASSSSLQRRLSVGYARAARILDQVYEAGFVGAANASKPREVYRDKIIGYLSGMG